MPRALRSAVRLAKSLIVTAPWASGPRTRPVTLAGHSPRTAGAIGAGAGAVAGGGAGTGACFGMLMTAGGAGAGAAVAVDTMVASGVGRVSVAGSDETWLGGGSITTMLTPAVDGVVVAGRSTYP